MGRFFTTEPPGEPVEWTEGRTRKKKGKRPLRKLLQMIIAPCPEEAEENEKAVYICEVLQMEK